MSGDSLTVTLNPTLSRFEGRIGADLAVAEFRMRDGRMILTHTEVPVEQRGRHVADRLAVAALEYARSRGLQVVPRCPYMASYIRAHPEYAGLVAPDAGE